MVEVLLIASKSSDKLTVLLKSYFQSKGVSISVVSSYESAIIIYNRLFFFNIQVSISNV